MKQAAATQRRDQEQPQRLSIPKAKLRTIIEQSGCIPNGVVNAKLTCTTERVLDARTYQQLVETSPDLPDCDSACLETRKIALANFLNRRLICTCIRLPGILYTFEIDPIGERLVHWEWQSA